MSNKKKKKKKNAGPPLALVRLSQCMIVKNEEKNIEKALSWAKKIAFEQIVVDTGSTDKTVEIAEKMGAKVFHFKWIDDFAAAKNYAIEQATGNWIAFLDADEFFSIENANKVMMYLKKFQSDPQSKEKTLALSCKISNVDDEGKPFAVFAQWRIFRNLPHIRYVGKIHERLSINGEYATNIEDITIIHTGYTPSAYMEANKRERNVELLRRELEQNPDNLNLKAYLADSLLIGRLDDNVKEAEALYKEVINGGPEVTKAHIKSAYLFLIRNYLTKAEALNEAFELSRRSLEFDPVDPDFRYYYAIALYNKGDYLDAWNEFLKVEEMLINDTVLDQSRFVSTNSEQLFTYMARLATVLNDVSSFIRYTSMLLMADKTKQPLLSSYIATLLANNTSNDDTIGLLEKIYDLNDANDLLIIAKASKDCGAIELARLIVEMIKT
ncbi:MAG: glycosyltransferase [Oscillospiraceae bacterium]|nr:glycosyltransferase [Oscillospiraceae bacterium]